MSVPHVRDARATVSVHCMTLRAGAQRRAISEPAGNSLPYCFSASPCLCGLRTRRLPATPGEDLHRLARERAALYAGYCGRIRHINRR